MRVLKIAVWLLVIAGGVVSAAVACRGEWEPLALESAPVCLPETFADSHADSRWSPSDVSKICSLWLGSLEELPPDPSNAYGDDPAAADFGHALFFDTRLSTSNAVSCATCHKPELNFTDGLSQPIGGGPRKTQTIVGTAYSDWFFWDGHKDSQWAQALEPFESELEHGVTRQQVVELIAADPAYRAQYEALFGAIPDLGDERSRTEVFVNIGKAIAAYERTIMPARARFDDYAVAVMTNDERGMDELFSDDEAAGLDIYINQGQCLNCHNDPLFTNHSFHGTNVFGTIDQGRIVGADLVVNDEFNCYSEWSDAEPDECDHLRFILRDVPELEGAFKTPTLRNVAEMAPYAHNGAFRDLPAILEHYNRGGLGAGIGVAGHNDLVPLGLSDEQLGQLEAFLRTLSGGIDAPDGYLEPPE